MKFNSIQFLIFFPLVAIPFFGLPHRWRWFLLLSASYLFYASWNPKYLVVLLTITIIGYLSGRMIERESARLVTRRLILTLSLLASLGVLFFFKYFELSNRALHYVFEQLGIAELIPGFNILLPLAILVLEAVHYGQRKYGSLREVIRRQPAWLRWPVYYALVVVIFMFGKFEAGEFIYARF